MQSNDNIPWVEKYRPTNFDNIVLDPANRTLFTNIIANEYFPNVLFYGPPGTGKTTTIINLIREFMKFSKSAKYICFTLPLVSEVKGPFMYLFSFVLMYIICAIFTFFLYF